jgi:hypothetical protein
VDLGKAQTVTNIRQHIVIPRITPLLNDVHVLITSRQGIPTLILTARFFQSFLRCFAMIRDPEQDLLVKSKVPVQAPERDVINVKNRVPPYTLIERCKPFANRVSLAQRYLYHLHFVNIRALDTGLIIG